MGLFACKHQILCFPKVRWRCKQDLTSSRTEEGLHMPLLSSILFPRIRTCWSAKTSNWEIFNDWIFKDFRIKMIQISPSGLFLTPGQGWTWYVSSWISDSAAQAYPAGMRISKRRNMEEKFYVDDGVPPRALCKKRIVLYLNFPSNTDSKSLWMIFFLYSSFVYPVIMY